jgi:hypothetical protein
MMEPVIQKIGDRLPGWKRGLLSRPGREMLIKSVLTAIPTYFLTVFKMTKWAFSRIDKFRRGFLWKGHDGGSKSGGHCLVNWKTCMRPKKWGGLGIKDLEKFSRSLRLRLLWHNWDIQDRPWKHLLRITDHIDRNLFFSSTVVHIGDGRNTLFWEARWLQGAAPKDLASNLFKLARFKHRNVYTELQNLNWIKNLGQLDTADLMHEFILLFMAISAVNLSDQKDKIFWKWTSNAKYTVASAYNCQFLGAMPSFPAPVIWTASSDADSKFFVWLVLHNRVLTAENMAKRRWPCDPKCSFCLYIDETTEHILTKCNYMEAAWNILAEKLNLPNFSLLNASGGPLSWVLHLIQSGSKREKINLVRRGRRKISLASCSFFGG